MATPKFGTALADALTGTSAAEAINAGNGADTITNFFGADTIDGGAGVDTLVLNGTALDLNNASDAQLINVEAIAVVDATAGVSINLSQQTEGFALTGSGFADTLTGGAGADNIIAGVVSPYVV